MKQTICDMCGQPVLPTPWTMVGELPNGKCYKIQIVVSGYASPDDVDLCHECCLGLIGKYIQGRTNEKEA